MEQERETYDYDKEILEAKRIVKIFRENLTDRVVPPIPSKSTIHFNALSLREVLVYRITELGEVAIDLFEKKKFVSAFIIVRSIQETLAMLFSLYDQIKKAVDSEDANKLSAFLKKALFGSGRGDSNSEEVLPKAHQILNAIDLIDKSLDGFRSNYDSLSNYVHPNWSGCLGAYSKYDKENFWLDLGTEVREVPISIGLFPFVDALQIFGRYYEKIGDLITPLYEICER